MCANQNVNKSLFRQKKILKPLGELIVAWLPLIIRFQLILLEIGVRIKKIFKFLSDTAANTVHRKSMKFSHTPKINEAIYIWFYMRSYLHVVLCVKKERNIHIGTYYSRKNSNTFKNFLDEGKNFQTNMMVKQMENYLWYPPVECF